MIDEKVRNYLRSTQYNINMKSMCCRLHRWHYERGTKVLYQTGQDAVSVEKVGTTYVLLDTIQTQISICCRLHRWHYERRTNMLYQTRQDAVIVEKVGKHLHPTRSNKKNKTSICCRLHRWEQERGTKILYQTRQDALIVKK